MGSTVDADNSTLASENNPPEVSRNRLRLSSVLRFLLRFPFLVSPFHMLIYAISSLCIPTRHRQPLSTSSSSTLAIPRRSGFAWRVLLLAPRLSVNISWRTTPQQWAFPPHIMSVRIWTSKDGPDEWISLASKQENLVQRERLPIQR